MVSKICQWKGGRGGRRELVAELTRVVHLPRLKRGLSRGKGQRDGEDC
jgi:hypothetical protein